MKENNEIYKSASDMYSEQQRLENERLEISNKRAYKFIELMKECEVPPITFLLDGESDVKNGWILRENSDYTIEDGIFNYNKPSLGLVLTEDGNTYKFDSHIDEYTVYYERDDNIDKNKPVFAPFFDKEGLNILCKKVIELNLI